MTIKSTSIHIKGMDIDIYNYYHALKGGEFDQATRFHSDRSLSHWGYLQSHLHKPSVYIHQHQLSVKPKGRQSTMSIHQTSLLKLEQLMNLINGVSLQAIYSKQQTATNNSIGASFLSNR